MPRNTNGRPDWGGRCENRDVRSVPVRRALSSDQIENEARAFSLSGRARFYTKRHVLHGGTK